MTPTEKLACFSKDRMKEFETGRFQAIFPKEREAAHKDHTPHIIVRIFAIHRVTRQYLPKRKIDTQGKVRCDKALGGLPERYD